MVQCILSLLTLYPKVKECLSSVLAKEPDFSVLVIGYSLGNNVNLYYLTFFSSSSHQLRLSWFPTLVQRSWPCPVGHSAIARRSRSSDYWWQTGQMIWNTMLGRKMVLHTVIFIKLIRYVVWPLELLPSSGETCVHSQRSQLSRTRWTESLEPPSRQPQICSTSWLPSTQQESQGGACWRWC